MFTQLLAGAVQHHPEVALGDVQPRANLGVRHFLDGVKLKHLRDARRELAQRLFQVGAQFLELEAAAGNELSKPNLKHGL